jgi:hypothetical protein
MPASAIRAGVIATLRGRANGLAIGRSITLITLAVLRKWDPQLDETPGKQQIFFWLGGRCAQARLRKRRQRSGA